jgi:hypothetical protein
MSPIIITGFFLVLGLYSVWALMNDLKTGTARNRGGTVDVRDNPGGFYLLAVIKVLFICFSTAVVLNAFGLIGDPFAWMRHYFPYMMPRQTG